MSSWSGTPSFFTPSSSAVRPQRSSDSVKTTFARVKLLSSWAICSMVSVSSRLIASCSGPGTVEKAAVRRISAMIDLRLWGLVHLEDVGVGLGGVGPDREADGLAHLVLRRAGGPGTCQVTLGSVGVAGGQVGRQVAQVRRLGVEHALLEFPRRDHPLFHQWISLVPRSLSLPGRG